MKGLFCSIAVLWLGACNTRNALPPGPAPEYEPPRVASWEAGRAASGDPFDEEAEGDWVEEDPVEDAGAPPLAVDASPSSAADATPE